MDGTAQTFCAKVRQTGIISVIVLIVLNLPACSQPNGGVTTSPPPLSSDKAITSFWIVSPDAAGSINESLKTIAVSVPFKTGVTSLVAGFLTTGTSVQVNAADQESTVTANDFTAPVVYTVKAEDDTTAAYTVTVTVQNTSTRGAIYAMRLDGSDVYAGGACTNRNGGSCGNMEGPGYWLSGAWVSIAGCSVDPWRIKSFAVSPGTVKTAGIKEDGSYNEHYGYWTNTAWTELFTVASNSIYNIENVFWNGTDLYACGDKRIDSTTVAPGYMLNGTWVDLVNPTNGQVKDIVVVGTDIYAAGGYTGPNAAAGFWLNGAWTEYPNPADTTGYSSCIAVSGGNVYVAGERTTLGITDYGYWLNGSWHSFAVPAGTYIHISQIVVSGIDVYFVGYIVVSGVYQAGYRLGGSWVGLSLPPYAEQSRADCLIVSGSDVYVGGWGVLPGVSGTVPGYWKNGVWEGF